MAYPGPSVGPWEVAELDVNLVNEVFRQIEEQINLLRGLRNDAIAASSTPVSIATHTHASASSGGPVGGDHGSLTGLTDNDHTQYRLTATDISHGTLTNLTVDDHSQYLLASDATSRAAFTSNWTDLTDAGDTTLHTHQEAGLDDAQTTASRTADSVLAGPNITITESDESEAVIISTTGFSGTVTPVVSITVSNGIVTAVS